MVYSNSGDRLGWPELVQGVSTSLKARIILPAKYNAFVRKEHHPSRIILYQLI